MCKFKINDKVGIISKSIGRSLKDVKRDAGYGKRDAGYGNVGWVEDLPVDGYKGAYYSIRYREPYGYGYCDYFKECDLELFSEHEKIMELFNLEL